MAYLADGSLHVAGSVAIGDLGQGTHVQHVGDHPIVLDGQATPQYCRQEGGGTSFFMNICLILDICFVSGFGYAQ